MHINCFTLRTIRHTCIQMSYWCFPPLSTGTITSRVQGREADRYRKTFWEQSTSYYNHLISKHANQDSDLATYNVQLRTRCRHMCSCTHNQPSHSQLPSSLAWYIANLQGMWTIRIIQDKPFTYNTNLGNSTFDFWTETLPLQHFPQVTTNNNFSNIQAWICMRKGYLAEPHINSTVEDMAAVNWSGCYNSQFWLGWRTELKCPTVSDLITMESLAYLNSICNFT